LELIDGAEGPTLASFAIQSKGDERMSEKGKREQPKGPGIRQLGNGREPYYGKGYCGCCGGEPVPVAVRWWDCDDGWKVGVLCAGCAEEIAARGPRAEDFACRTRGAAGAAAYDARRIDVEAEVLGEDLDCLLDD
jgi:hypothetical protein